jgi:hypothetical protein
MINVKAKEVCFPTPIHVLLNLVNYTCSSHPIMRHLEESRVLPCSHASAEALERAKLTFKAMYLFLYAMEGDQDDFSGMRKIRPVLLN